MKNTLLPGSLCFWSWNDLLEKNEIRRQMEEFSAGRFSGVVIHSRAGLRNAYLGEDWFNFYRFAVQQAKRLGMEIWIYDEDGWPSGFAGGRVPAMGEEYQAKRLVFSRFERTVPENVLCCWRETDGEYLSISPKNLKAGDLICGYKCEQSYVDLLSEKTVRAFLDETHERYKAELGIDFGTVIRGFFTDEPQYMNPPWSFDLPAAWMEQHGTELVPQLYLLTVDAPQSKQFRVAFYQTVSDLICHSFTQQITRWCDENGLLFTGHFSSEDGLVTQIAGNAGVMRNYAVMSMPGIDHLGNRLTSPVLCKQLSAVAHQFSKPEVLSETFGCVGWQITFDRLAWIWGRESALGVTKPCYHLSAYSMAGRRKRDYPAFYSYQEPWWEQFPLFQKRIDRLNALMKDGTRAVDTMVISPLDDVAANAGTKQAEWVSSQYRALLENLLQIQLDFEPGDETLIAEHGRAENGKFIIGAAAYSLVIVPHIGSLRRTTVRLLERFSAAGGKIWYIGGTPKVVDFSSSDYPQGITVQNRVKALEDAVTAFGPVRPVTLRHPRSLALKKGAILHTRNLTDGNRVHIWTDEDFCAGETVVSFPAEDGEQQICAVDLSDGKKTQLVTAFDGAFLTATVELPSSGNIVLETEHTSGKAVSPSEISVTRCLRDVKVRVLEPNVLPIDYAAVSVGDEPYGEYLPLVRNLDQIYKRLQNSTASETQVGVRYRFFCDDGVDIGTLSAVIEDEFVKEILVNGKQIGLSSTGWWIDRKFREYPIGTAVIPGENAIELIYELKKEQSFTDGFETERNRFFFTVEPESVYIRGNFDVFPGGVTNHGNRYELSGNFLLMPPTQKYCGDFTAQNAWFYRGNLEYTFHLAHRTDRRVFLKPMHAHGTAAVVSCRGEELLLNGSDQMTEITSLLNDGDNEITVLLLGSNRNLLGPHHHIKGETAMVGPNTFAGIHGFEDFVSPDIDSADTWTDSYTVIPFGCDGFLVAETEAE